MRRIERIAKAEAKAIILREKDLSENEYQKLAEQVMEICKRYGTTCILHSFVDVALKLHATAIHLPMSELRMHTQEQRQQFKILGASCHSIEEAMEAERLGCTYITAGHIFDTDCKKGTPGRGLIFLQEVCESVRIPVYAIGGITPETYRQVIKAGAAGACVMSGMMKGEEFL